MSVTFAPRLAPGDTETYRLTCELQGPLGDWVGYGNAYGEAKAHGLVCENNLCSGYGAEITPLGAELAEVTLSQDNARRVLDVLGYPTDGELSGSDDAQAFMGRVLVALAIAPYDEGMPARRLVADEQTLFRGGNQWHLGREAGHLQECLTRLNWLALDCVAQGVAVMWA